MPFDADGAAGLRRPRAADRARGRGRPRPRGEHGHGLGPPARRRRSASRRWRPRAGCSAAGGSWPAPTSRTGRARCATAIGSAVEPSWPAAARPSCSPAPSSSRRAAPSIVGLVPRDGRAARRASSPSSWARTSSPSAASSTPTPIRGLLDTDGVLGLKHSSLRRDLEWERLALRDARRPDFRIYTGNDLAIDMVMYGSDYLLGLSAFAPEAFARRDRYWREGDARFHAAERPAAVPGRLRLPAAHAGLPAQRRAVPEDHRASRPRRRARRTRRAGRTATWRCWPTSRAACRSCSRPDDGPSPRRVAAHRRRPAAPPRRAGRLASLPRASRGRARSARAALRGRRRAHGRQSLLHPAHGGLGRDGGRRADRPHAPALAALRLERRQAHLGRRGGGGEPRGPRQPATSC